MLQFLTRINWVCVVIVHCSLVGDRPPARSSIAAVFLRHPVSYMHGIAVGAFAAKRVDVFSRRGCSAKI